jgi:DNA-binding YbaB/EbfC family protein
MAGYRGGFGGGFGGGNNMQALMRQAQKMQEDMKRAQEELDEMQIEGIAMNGLVKVIMNGKKVISSINISPDAVDTDDMTMLEDLIIVAINDGYAKADKAYNEKMGAFAGMGL